MVHLVSEEGAAWTKIVARNPKNLHRAWAAGDSQAERSIADTAAEFQYAAEGELHLFRPPRLRFLFQLGVPAPLAAELREMGVEVVGELVPESELPQFSRLSSSEDEVAWNFGPTTEEKVWPSL